jgi:hypothetical protein
MENIYEKLKLKWNLYIIGRKIRHFDFLIQNHDGALSEFGPVSKEFSLRLVFYKIGLENQRNFLVQQRNKLEKQLYVI